MTVITGTWKDVGAPVGSGWMIFSSVLVRPSTVDAGAMVTTNRTKVPIRQGRFTTPELDPGMTLVELDAPGCSQRWTIAVPVEGEHNFASLIDAQLDYDPEVVSQAWQAARAAQEAAKTATAVAETLGSAKEISDSRDAAVAARGEALSAQAGAVSARDASVSSAAASAQSASDSAAARDAAVVARGGAELAQAGAEAARDAAVVAQGKAETAEGGAVSAQSAAEAARDTAAGSAGDAASSATDAASSASDAQASAAAAAQSEATASSAAAGAASGVRSELSGLVSDASGHASAAASSAAAAAQSAQDAASVVSDGVPDASTSMKGKVKLAGDLAGTADNPTVPGLATKANVGHTHPVNQVTGLQSALDAAIGQKVDKITDSYYLYASGPTGQLRYSSAATPSTVAFRTDGGQVAAATPTAATHAATKDYVDAVKTTADAALPASKIQVVTAMPDSPVAGTIYLVTGA